MQKKKKRKQKKRNNNRNMIFKEKKGEKTKLKEWNFLNLFIFFFSKKILTAQFEKNLIFKQQKRSRKKQFN